MTFLAAPAPQLSFGDVCEADIFYDAYLRADASPLRERTVTAPYIRKQFGVDSLTSYIAINTDVPALKAQEGFDFLLAHGTAHPRAICLSDDCEIASRLGRDDEAPSGRLLFAPVTAVKSEEADTLTNSNLGRMALGEGSVVEFRRVFGVAAQDVAAHAATGELERHGLVEDTLTRLATWWAAYACRRGPLVSATNLAKLAAVLDAHGIDAERAGAARTALIGVATSAWRLDGRSIEAAGQRHDEARPDLDAVDLRLTLIQIGEDLKQLASAVGGAQRALAAVV